MQQGRESESFLHLGAPSSMYTQFHDVLYTNTVHDLHFYLVCPDLLVAVGKSSYEILVGFIESTHCLYYLFINYVFVFVVQSLLLSSKENKNRILTTTKKPSLPFRNNLCFY